MKFLLLLLFLLLISPVMSFCSGIIPAQADSGKNCSCNPDRKTARIYQEGIDQLKRSAYSGAAQQIRLVLKSEPECIDAYYALGIINFRKKDYNLKEAERCFLKVIGQCPDYDIYAYYYLGEINYGLERYDQAAAYLAVFLKDAEKIKTDEDYNRARELMDYSNFINGLTTSPVPFDPKVVEGISTEQNEYLPILSPDNQLAFFTREIKLQPDRNSLTQEVRYKEKFCFSTLDSSGNYGPGEIMEEPFNIQDNEGGATLTADNHTLYYTVCRYDATKRYLNCDIYMSENAGGYWQPIRNAGNTINSDDSWESQPSVSADGRILYFVSDRKGGLGGYDIYRSMKGDNGEWGVPVNLGSPVNSKGNEKSPFIHPDGKTLYYSSDGLMGMGGYDIFFTRSYENGEWEKPKNIGYPINSPEDEVGFFVSTDGTKGFFCLKQIQGSRGLGPLFFRTLPGRQTRKGPVYQGKHQGGIFRRAHESAD